MPTFIIDSTPISHICIFCKSLAHLVGNYPYRSSQLPIVVIGLIFGTTQPIISVNTQIPMTQVLVVHKHTFFFLVAPSYHVIQMSND
jgi:hypothetical protein